MKSALRMLVLVTDGFGGVGGIAKFNRDFLQALDCSGLVERVLVLPRLIAEPINESVIPEAVVYDREAAGGKLAFIRRVAAQFFRADHINVVVCGHINLLSTAWLAARSRGAGLALIIHGIEAWQPPHSPMTRRLARNADALISVSRFTAHRFSNWSGVPKDDITIMPNCVDLDRFQPQQRDMALVKRYGLQSGRVIMTMGRLDPRERYKGFDEVINVMPQLLERFSNLKYLIVGDGPDRARLEAKAAGLDLAANVVFTGYVPESEKVAHYNLADVYVMPSTGEGFGIVLIEAAACGVPVVGSKADGSREALLNERLGRLVDPKKHEELIQAIAAVLESPPTRQRIEAIDLLSVQNFRARVADWCAAQIAA